MGIFPGYTWEYCIQRYQGWENQIKQLEIKFANDPILLERARNLVSPKYLERQRAMVDLVKILMEDKALDNVFRIIRLDCLELGTSVVIGAYAKNEYSIGFELPNLNLKQTVAAISYYFDWKETIEEKDPAQKALYDVIDDIYKLYGQEQEMLINKYLSDSSARILPQRLANIRKVAFETIQKIFAKVGKEFDVNDNPNSENPSENALYQIWQILRELYPFELELMQNGNVSEFTAEIFARDLARMRELANEAISLIRAKEFEQFENLKDEDND